MPESTKRSVKKAAAKRPARKRPAAKPEVVEVVRPDRVADLVMARDRLVAAIVADDGGALASLVRELRATLADLADLAPPAEGTALDDLATRRAERKSGTDVLPRAGRF
jgi:hypothetical protein